MRKRGRGLIEGVLMVILVAALLWPLRAGSLTPLARAVIDGFHYPVFLLATILIFRGFPPERFSGTRALLALAGGLLLAGIVEGLQSLLGRQASVEDFLRGASGAVMGALGCFLFSGDWHHRWAYVVTAIAIGLLEFIPAGRFFMAERLRDGQFPVLGDFEKRPEIRLWTPQGINGLGEVTTIDRGEAFASRGTHSLRVKTSGGGGYAGVSVYLGAQDGSAHDALVWEIWNPGDSFTLGIRIDDDGDVSKAESRFATSLEVARGESAFRIPLDSVRAGALTRKVNLQAIERIVFYTDINSPPRLFFLDGLRLEKAKSGGKKAGGAGKDATAPPAS